VGLGNAETVVGPLIELVGEHPVAEPLVAAAMRALYLAGRRADALDCYANVRHRLAEELGLDPGAQLQRLHQAILRDEIDVPEPAPAAVPRARPPAMLPLDVYGVHRSDRRTEPARRAARRFRGCECRQ